MAETTQNSKQNVQAPQAGQTVIVNAIPGQDIVLEAAFDQAEVKMDGGNVVFEFEGGGQVVLNFTDLGDAQAPNVVMPDGTVLDMQEFLASLGESDVEPAAGPEGGADGSGGVGQYREGAGDLLGSVEKLGGLEDDPFPAVTLASIEANDENPLPTAGIVGGAVDEDGLRLSEGAHFEGNDDEVGGDNPARFSYLDGTLNYDFGGDGPAGTNPFVWSLVGLPVVFSEGNQLVYEVVDGGLTLNAYYITEGFIYPPNQEENSSEMDRMEGGPERVDVFSLKLTDLDDGTFRFELYQPLDHADTTTEDDINYGFTFTLTDGSGDSVVGGLNLVIDDDSPLATADGSELPSMVLDESSFGTGLVDAPQETANLNIASAISLDGHFTLGSNPDVGDSETTPFVSISGVGSGQPDYYMFTVTNAGSTAVFDIDYGMNYGGSFDPYVHLWNSEGVRIAYDDDQGGDPGSYHSYDSYLTYTFAEPGTYYISVGRYPGFSDPDNAIPNGGTYQLQVSLTNAIMGSGDGDGIRTLTTDFSGYFDFSFGADGPEGEGVNYAMSLGAESVESGIYALGEDGQPGEQIMLSLDESGSIIGTTEGSSPYFSISVDAETGRVTFVQFLNVWHGDTEDHDDAVTMELLAGSILLTATATDGDGDTASASLDLSSGIFGIEDDGPSADLKPEMQVRPLVVDESPLDDPETPEFEGDGIRSASADMTGFFVTPDFGTDGPGNVGYALLLTGIGVGSGLFAVDPGEADGQGDQILLYQNAITGAVDGKVGDQVYFTISVDNDSGSDTFGHVTFEQTVSEGVSIWHAQGGDAHDDASSLIIDQGEGELFNSLQLVQTVMDADGDTDQAALDLGSGVFVVEDDGPSVSGDTIVVLDDEGLENGISGGLGDVPGEATVVEGVLGHDFGADGAGSISFASMHETSGTVGVETVSYSWDAGTNTLLATGPRGPVFQVEVTDPATGAYEFTLLGNVLHEAGETLAVNVGNYAGLASMVTVGVMVSGDPAASLINNGGAFGIQSSVDGGNGGRFNEINYDLVGNPTGSEVMVFQLQGERIASSAVVDMTRFYGNETGVGNEVGSYELWLDGVKVQDAVAFQANSGTGKFQLAISGPEGGFDEIRFAALPGTDPTGNDDSDYNIEQVAFDLSYENDAHVDLLYTVADGDGDTAQGTLHLVINDDMPKAVENLAGAPQSVESFQAGSLQAGWVGDPDNNGLFDPNVLNKYDPDNDGDFQKIDWGTESGRSSYEFLDNAALQDTDPLELGLGSFLVGTFVHNNFPISSGTGINTAHLNVSFDVTVGTETKTVNHTIKFDHNETPNSPGPGDDIVTIIDGTNIVEVEFGGLKYELELGFKSGDNIVTEVMTAENASTSVELVAELTLVPEYLDLEGTVAVEYGADGPGSLAWIGVDDGEIEGEYGTLTVLDDGAYEYNLTADTVPEGAFETFNYTVSDADGDSAISTLNIMLDYKGEIG